MTDSTSPRPFTRLDTCDLQIVDAEMHHVIWADDPIGGKWRYHADQMIVCYNAHDSLVDLVGEMLPHLPEMKMHGGGFLNEEGIQDGLKHVNYKCPLCKTKIHIPMPMTEQAPPTKSCTNPDCLITRARKALEELKA